jgi:cytochrome b pre-mRNA-processing protein 3
MRRLPFHRHCLIVSATIWTTICGRWVVGDLTVPERMRAFGEAFYGRAAAYDLALDAGEEPFAQALCKNILNGKSMENARWLALYAKAAMASLSEQRDTALLAGSWKFLPPTGQAAQTVSRT